MATKVYEEETLVLQDGTEITVRPLNIKNLRRFMEVVKDLDKVENDLEGMDIMFDACKVAMEQFAPEMDSDRLEEAMDLPTMMRVMELAGGIKMGEGGNPLTAEV